MKKILLLTLLGSFSAGAFSQHSGFREVSLQDMSEFKPNAGNWFVVGNVYMNRNVDIHEPPPPPPPEEPARRRKRKRKEPVAPPVPPPSPVSFENGTGILLNMTSKEKRDHLVTNWEHGDIELVLDVMMPMGSNSGVYLQGGYEVQLLDSWGPRIPKYGDIGGIYRNWEKEPGKIYLGKAPLVNAAKAPGLWQTLEISFRAPRFDANGKKIANAKFVYVKLNGTTIHDDVEVPQLTGGPLHTTERATGPLMIQGDHGAVAFRNIRYRLLKESQVTLAPISYNAYYGTTGLSQNFGVLKPVASGAIDAIDCNVVQPEDSFAVVYTGTLNIPETDEYQFELNYSGEADLTINGEDFLDDQINRGRSGKISLEKGAHPFRLVYTSDGVSWNGAALGLFVSSSNTPPKALHAFSSLLPGKNTAVRIPVDAGPKVKLLRAFLDFNGEREKRLTHTIAVGDPQGIHYIYDLKSANIVCGWHGPFLDATPMWHRRGDGSFRPDGPVQYFFSGSVIAALPDSAAAFPAHLSDNAFRGEGYRMKDRPEFLSTYGNMAITDKIYPDPGNKFFIRELSFGNYDSSSVYLKLAEGSEIEKLPDGAFAVDDKKYYIELHSPTAAFIRESAGRKELVAKIDGSPVKYSIIW